MRKLFLLFIVCLHLSTNAQVKIDMEKRGGVFYINGKVNGLPLKFIFDTGASTVSLSLTEAIFMLKNGYLDPSDIKGNGYSQVASGEIIPNSTVQLKKIEIGGITIQNVEATIVENITAPLLLGQSAIQKLGPIRLDGTTLTIQRGRDFNNEETVKNLSRLAYQYNEAGRYEDAKKTCLEGLSLTDRKKARSYLYLDLAIAYYYLGEKEKCLDICYKGIAETDFVQLIYNQGVYLFEMKEFDKSEKAFQSVLNGGHVYYEPDEVSEAIRSSHQYLGLIKFRHQQYSAAEKELVKYVSSGQDPYIATNQHALNCLGEIYEKMKSSQKAIVCYESAIRCDERGLMNIERYYKLGYLYFEQEDYSKSIDYYKQCVSKFNSHSEDIYATLDDENPELQEKSMILCFSYCKSLLNLGKMNYMAERNDVAYTYFNKLMGCPILNKPEVPEFLFAEFDYLILHDCCVKNRQNTNAAFIIGKALEQYPGNPDFLYLQTDYLEDDEKLAVYEQILKQEKSYSPKVFDYGTVSFYTALHYYVMEDDVNAYRYASHAIELKNDNGNFWMIYGICSYNIGKHKESLDALNKALKLGCQRPDEAKKYRDMAKRKLR